MLKPVREKIKHWDWRSLTPVQVSVGVAVVLLAAVHLIASVVAVGCHRHQLKRQLSESILREGEHRAAAVSLFLNDCRNDVRELLQSRDFQDQLRHSANASEGIPEQAMRGILRRFITEDKLGKASVFSHVLFVERNGVFVEESADDGPPLRLTLDFVKGLIETLYVTPTLMTHEVEDQNPALLLSSACILNGKYQGQMLAWINPAALDFVLTNGPAADSLAVYLVLEGRTVYAPLVSPRRLWENAAVLSDSDANMPTFFEGPDSAGSGLMVGIRIPLVNSEFSIALVRRASALEEGPARYWFPTALAAFIAVVLALFLLPFRSRLVAVWGRICSVPGLGAVPAGMADITQIALRDVADAVFVTDSDGNIEYTNHAFEVITGYEARDVLGRHPRLLKSGKHPDAFYRKFMSVIKRGDSWRGTIINQRKDGTYYHAKASVTPIRNEAGAVSHYVAVTSDITAQIAAEERLRQSQKMEAIGELVGGVAHDFNNLITVIQGNCNLLLFGLGDVGPTARENIDEIMKASDRAASLTRRLLAFSRRKDAQPELLELNEVITNTEKMLRRLIRENIQIRITVADEPVHIEADLVQIEQMLINLAVNARDAMPAGGVLSIGVGTRRIGTEDRNTTLPSGDYAELTVADTGLGMDDRTKARIFEPFFTTKHDKGGTGLGLATVNGIVKQNGGDIVVTSEPGDGAAFTILLPRKEAAEDSCERAVEVAPDHTPAPEPTPMLCPTVLVVDDEDSVLKMIQQALEASGYVVYSARTDDELLALWKRHKQEIDLLITDVMMPGMSGVEVAAHLRQDREDLTVLYISAYTDSVMLQFGGEHNEREFLPKPFTPDALLARVRDMLRPEPDTATV